MNVFRSNHTYVYIYWEFLTYHKVSYYTVYHDMRNAHQKSIKFRKLAMLLNLNKLPTQYFSQNFCQKSLPLTLSQAPTLSLLCLYSSKIIIIHDNNYKFRYLVSIILCLFPFYHLLFLYYSSNDVISMITMFVVLYFNR